MLEVVVAQPLLVAAQQEVVVLLFEPDELGAVHRALAVDQVALVVEGLAGGAVLAAVGALFDVAGGPQPFDEALHVGFVLGVGRADEEVVRGVHLPRHLAELRGQGVDVGARREAGELGRLGHLVAVLVGAGQKEDVVAELAVVPRQDVGGDRGVGVPQVGVGVHVVDGGGDGEAAHVLASLLCSLTVKP